MSDHSPQISTLDQAMQFAATQGVKLTPADYRAIAEIEQAEADRISSIPTATTSTATRLIEGFNRYYPQFLRSLVGLSQVLITTSQTVIVSFGVPLVLVLLLIVEHSRVMHGIMLFEASAALASFAAWSIVILNTVLEFVIHHIDHQAGYKHQRANRASLRLKMQQFAYWLGVGSHWRAQELPPSERYRRLLRLVTFSILALALAGSMQGAIEEMSRPAAAAAPGITAGTTLPWYDALWSIAADSTLSQMTTWLGGLLFALAAVAGAQNLTAYLAQRTAEILADMDKRSAAPQKTEAAAVQYILAKVHAQQLKAAAPVAVIPASYEASEVAANPFLGITPPKPISSNGNGHH